MQKCFKCGGEVETGDAFCPWCGASIAKAPAAAKPEPPKEKPTPAAPPKPAPKVQEQPRAPAAPPAPKGKGRGKLIAGVVGTVVVVVVVISAAVLLMGGGGTSTTGGTGGTGGGQGENQLPENQQMPSGLVAYWKFDEGSGSTASDSSGNSNNGTLENMNTSTCWVNGKSGKALSFDGTNDYVAAPSSSNLNVTGGVTVEAWIKLNAVSKDQKIVGRRDGSAGGYLLGVYSNNKVEFEIRNATNTAYLNRNTSGGTVLTAGQWYRVVGVYSDTDNYLATYVNGQLDREMTTTGALASTTGSLTIGKESSVNSCYWTGVIDEVKIYNRALSASEVLADYTG